MLILDAKDHEETWLKPEGRRMKYTSVVPGRFFCRMNRFIAKVEIDGWIEVVHVKNTGRCKELLIEGAIVYLSESENPARKTRYDLVAVVKESTGNLHLYEKMGYNRTGKIDKINDRIDIVYYEKY